MPWRRGVACIKERKRKKSTSDHSAIVANILIKGLVGKGYRNVVQAGKTVSLLVLVHSAGYSDFFLVASGQYALLSIPASLNLTFFLQGLSDLCTAHLSLFELVLSVATTLV